MYSWKAIRTACTILLLLPIVHLAYLVTRDTVQIMNVSPDAWAPEIQAYATADALAQLPKDPIVIVGGQRVKLWRDLEDLLTPRPVLMRGLGDAIVEDITHYYRELVGFYRPHTLVLLPSNSEFFIRDNKSPEGLLAAIRKLAKLDEQLGTTRRLYVISPLKTPLRPQDNQRIEQSMQLLQGWADTDERVAILDANALLSGPDGRAKPDFYRADGVNLNEHGYLRLSLLLRDQLERDNTEDSAL